MDKINVAVAGIGRIGSVHTQNLLNHIPNAALKAICDGDVKRTAVYQNYGINSYSDFSAMLNTESLDAVIICTPTPLHFDMIEESFSHGLHVFCEKPLDKDLKNIKRLHQFSLKSKLKLQVGFNRRFDSNFSHIHLQVKEQHIGDPHILKITSRDPSPPSLQYLKSSGGMFMDMTIHDFDMARYIVGSEVSRVYATADVLIDPIFHQAEDIDTAIIVLDFDNGAKAVIDNSRQAIYGYDQRLEILGSEGMLKADNKFPHNTHFFNKSGTTSPRPYDFFMERYADSFKNEMTEFVNSIITDNEVMVSGLDAYNATALAIGAQESLLLSKPVVPKRY